MTLQPGTSFGNYEIVAPVGAGGMGEVYRAKDTKLGRDVAIKVLPEELTRDMERLNRFEREARVLAQLNHTNIATIHGLEEFDGQPLLVMELVEGETLAEQIAREALAIDDAIAIFVQIAEGLEAAHDKGIVHRDLKPANIMITPDGHVKILDFGLAKAFHDETGLSDDASQSPTLTKGTALGVILGTASYMSPEQARGKPVGKRTDLWAFGCCLYEALAGKKAFTGETTTDILAAIVNADPSWEKLPTETPGSVRRLLRRCLVKSSRDRLGDASTARIELREPADHDVGPAMGKATRRVPSLILASAFLVAAIAFAMSLSREPASTEARRVSITVPTGLTIEVSELSGTLDISPDGRWIAYLATSPGGSRQLYVRGIHHYDARRIETLGNQVSSPRFSPDSKWLAYFERGDVFRVSTELNQGPERFCSTRLGNAERGIMGLDWDSEGAIVYSRRALGIWRCRTVGAETEPVTTVDLVGGEGRHVYPDALPDGSAVLFAVRSPANDLETELAVLRHGDSEHRLLGIHGTSPRFLPSGHIAFGRGGSLYAAPFDPDTLEVGESSAVIGGVSTRLEAAGFAVADNGSLIYLPGAHVDETSRKLVWADRDGQTEPIDAPSMPYIRLSIAPDGTRVALEARGASSDVWVWDLERETMTRVTFDPALEGFPVWGSNTSLFFESHRVAQGNVFEKASDGTGTSIRVLEHAEHQVPLAASPNGKWLVLESRDLAVNNQNLFLLSRETKVGRPLLDTEFVETNAKICPTTGRWIAYESDESGRTEVYVRPFPNVEDGKWLVSSDGGRAPIWSRDGDELFFWNEENHLSAVDVRVQGGFSWGRPETLFDGSAFYTEVGSGNSYDVASNGRFLMIEAPTSSVAPATELHLVLNWLDEVELKLAAAE